MTVASPAKAKLTFGLLYDMRNPPAHRRPWAQLYAETLDFIAWTEELGFDAAWMPEHHVDEDGYLPSPLIALAAVAARTHKLRIGSAVALPSFYHPVRFAEDTATLNVLSNGRFELGIALGYRRRETAAYGIDFPSRVSRMEEFVGIVRRLWQGDTVTVQGRHFNLTNASIMPRPLRGDIPLLIGGFNDKALDRVARLGDGYMGMPELSDAYKAKLALHGKDPAAARIYVPSVNLVVDDDPERAMNELAPYYHYVNNKYGEWLGEDSYESRIEIDAAPQAMSLNEFKASGLLQVLTPNQAIAKFQKLREVASVEHIIFSVPSGVPYPMFSRYVETFAEQVLPTFRYSP